MATAFLGAAFLGSTPAFSASVAFVAFLAGAAFFLAGSAFLAGVFLAGAFLDGAAFLAAAFFGSTSAFLGSTSAVFGSVACTFCAFLAEAAFLGLGAFLGAGASAISASTVSSVGRPATLATSGKASSMPRRGGSRACTTKVRGSPRFRTSFALRGGGSERPVSGT